MPRDGASSILFVIPSGDFLPSGVVRVKQFVPMLEALGVRCDVLSYYHPGLDRASAALQSSAPSITRRIAAIVLKCLQVFMRWRTRAQVLLRARGARVVFFQGVLPPIWYTKVLQRLNPRIVLDMDDAIFLGNPARGDALLPLMWKVVAGSHFIFDYAKARNPRVMLVPSAVAPERYNAAAPLSADRPIRIGWLGSSASAHYLHQLVEPLRALTAEGWPIELLIDGASEGHRGLPDLSGLRVTFTSSYTDADIPALVARYDIGVLPLDDGPWERAKCAMKALIYMAAEKPAVCSRVGENVFVIEDGANGFLAASPNEWIEKLRALIVDAGKRAEFGRSGRRTVDERYSARVCFETLNQHVFSAPAARVLEKGRAL